MALKKSPSAIINRKKTFFTEIKNPVRNVFLLCKINKNLPPPLYIDKYFMKVYTKFCICKQKLTFVNLY